MKLDLSTEAQDAADAWRPPAAAENLVGRPMRLLGVNAYRGPHLYSALPMIRLQLDLGDLESFPTDRLPGFVDALTAKLPGLLDHGCGNRSTGGFARRLVEGTWLGHVTEHVALELQTLAGHAVSRGKTRTQKDRPGAYNVMFAYQDEAVGRLAGEVALRLVDSLLPIGLQGITGLPPATTPFELASAQAALREAVRKAALGPTTDALVREAKRRGVPVARLNAQSLIRLGWGAQQQLIRASVTGATSLVAAEAAGDKALAKSLLAAAGLPVPRGEVVRDAEAAVAAAARLGGPVVTKPLDGNHGRGVNLNLRDAAAVAWGFAQAAQHGRRVIVEEQYEGRDYRILVVDRKIVAVAERRPAAVTGDGRRSIAELVETVNRDPRRGRGHEAVMTRITLDDHARAHLSEQGLTADHVPGEGVEVVLRTTANLSTGGLAIDRTDEIHPDNAAIARRAAAVIGLDIAGIDFLAPDIARSVRETGGGIVEVNAAPGFRMHLAPSEGESRDVAGPVIDMLFPRGRRARIPIVAVTGTNGKSTTVRMIEQILARQGRTVGFTTTSGVYIGDERVLKADASGPISARMVLADPTVEVAVLETARGGILREGLGFDRCDVGCVLNISDDHLGLKGVMTLEDLAAVKSVVTESVSRRGVSVLNADDPLTRRMARHAGGRVAFFSMQEAPESRAFVAAHVAGGGLAAVVERDITGEQMVLLDGGRRRLLTPVAAVPATMAGQARFNIANALAASLVAHGLGVPPDTIAAGLASFQSSFADNPGRLNIHDAHGFRVIVDYAHNPAGIAALGELLLSLRPGHRRTIGCVSIPGDRRDADILAMGASAAALFDHIVFREKPDGRGRKPGEVIGLLRRGALEAGCSEDRVEGLPREADAIAACLERARSGDLVVLLPTDVEAAWAQVLAFSPAGAAPDA